MSKYKRSLLGWHFVLLSPELIQQLFPHCLGKVILEGGDCESR